MMNTAEAGIARARGIDEGRADLSHAHRHTSVQRPARRQTKAGAQTQVQHGHVDLMFDYVHIVIWIAQSVGVLQLIGGNGVSGVYTCPDQTSG